MNKRAMILSSVFAAALLPMVVHADNEDRQAEQLARFEQYAGTPVSEFRLWKLHGWQQVGRYQLVLWTTINDAYLVTLQEPCFGLDFAKSVGVSSTVHTVSAKFDTVNVGEDRCRIQEIRPIDYRRLKVDEAAKASADKTSQAQTHG